MQDSKQYSLDEYARNVIRHKARQLIGRYGFTHEDYEDVRQEMTLDLLARLPKFDSDIASQNTFVARIIDRKISTMIRHRMQEKRDFRREAGSLDDPINDGTGGTVERGETISQDEHDLRTGQHTRPEAERIDMKLDVSIAMSEIPPELKPLAERLLTHSITEAAREFGVPRGTLYETGIARLRKAFEYKGLREYL